MESPLPFMPVPQPACAGISAAREAELRQRVVTEATSWVGTPYVQQGDVKGQAVDCAMLLVRCWVDAGVFQPFDPRPYPPNWHLHHDDERYLRWMQALAVEVAQPQIGDVLLYHFGRCLSHGAILVAPGIVCNSSAIHMRCTLNDTKEAWLASMKVKSGAPVARPMRAFDVFARLRA